MASIFDDPTPAPSSGGTIFDAPAGPTPSGSSQTWLDHLHNFAQGFTAATRVATDLPTGGLVDKLFSTLPRPQQPQTIANLVRQQITGQPGTGNPYSPTGDPQADTAAAYKQMGGWSVPLALAGGTVTGQAEFAGAKAIGEAIAPSLAKLPLTGAGKWLGGVLGSAAVGAPISALGAYGHEAGWTPDWSDIGTQAAIGGALSAGAATLGGVVGRGGQAAQQQAPMPTAAELEKTMKGGFAKAGNELYDNADVRQGATNAIDEINQAPARIARNGQGALAALSKIGDDYALGPGVQSGEDLNDFIKSLKTAKTGDDVDVAGRIGQKHMQNILDNVTPVVGQPGAGGAAINEANQAFGRIQDLERLGDQPTKAAITKTQSNYQPGSPEYQAADDALNAMNPLLNWYAARHVAAPLVGAAVGGVQGFTNSAEGQNPYLNALWHAGEDALLFEGGRKLVAARPQGAFDALRYAIGTGQTKLVLNPPLRNALQTLLLSSGGSGTY